MKKLIFSLLIAVLLINLWSEKTMAQDKPYRITALDTAPAYPGGMAKFYEFLGSTIKYPEAAVKENIQGNVFVSFVIEKDGSLNNIKVNQPLGGGTDEEAVRVLSLSKKWKPGIKDGMPVRTVYNIPVKFAIPGKKANPKVASTVNSAAPVDENSVYNFVGMEHPPTYPGGIAEFYKFLGNNIKYPEVAKANKIQGNVFVSFTVEKDGSLSNITVNQKLGGGTDEEAIRVLKLTKRWNPGLQDNKPVRVKYNIPIQFRLPK